MNRHGFHGSYLFKDGLIGDRDSLDALSIRENPYGAIGTNRWMCCHPTDRFYEPIPIRDSFSYGLAISMTVCTMRRSLETKDGLS